MVEDFVALQLWLPQSSSVVVWGWGEWSPDDVDIVESNLKLRRLNKGTRFDGDLAQAPRQPLSRVQCLCTNAPQRVGV